MTDTTMDASRGRGHLNKTRLLVLTALLFAIALVLAIVENTIPPLPFAVPGVKLGLSNIVVMFALFFLERWQAFAIAILKALFVVAVRGVVAGILSFSGGMLSLLVMIVLIWIFKDRISYLLLSIFGAVFHNIGQFFAITLIYTNIRMWVYLPVLLFAGVAAGAATSVLLRFILPAFKNAGFK